MAPPADRRRATVTTQKFRAWARTLDPERKEKVRAATQHIAAGGPTLGRPHVDVIHGSKIAKLKEVRINRGTRVLFAFDSRQNVVMLVGGDKTGKWNRWYPANIKVAKRLYADHESSMRKEPRCLNPRAAGRPSTGMSR